MGSTISKGGGNASLASVRIEEGRVSTARWNTLAVISGRLPARALGMVVEWASLHHEELVSLWEKAKNLEPLHKVDPLP